MSAIETAYLTMVIVGFLVFMLALAYGSLATWQVQRAEHARAPVKTEHRDAA